jgi:hypothetical protein
VNAAVNVGDALSKGTRSDRLAAPARLSLTQYDAVREALAELLDIRVTVSVTAS